MVSQFTAPRAYFDRNAPADWPKQLADLLQNNQINSQLDAVIDSAGGDIMGKVSKLLKQGGRVVCYGM